MTLSSTALRAKITALAKINEINVVRTSAQYIKYELYYIITVRIDNGKNRLSLQETAKLDTILRECKVDFTIMSIHNRSKVYPPRIRYKIKHT